MSQARKAAPRTPRLPRWLLAGAVLLTAAVTAWAMSQTRLRGPQDAWGQAQGGVQAIWSDGGDAMGGAQAGAWDAAATAGQAARPVAGLPGVPVILMGQNRPHADRGACANCHSVVRNNGRPVPPIHSFSSMPHGFRGVCSNCHQVTLGQGGNGNPVAATMMVPPSGAPMQPMQAMPMQPMPMQPMQQPMQAMQAMPMQQPMQAMPMQQPMQAMPMQQPMQAQGFGAQPMATAPANTGMAPPPNDADWRGLEVRQGAQGVVVTKAEGAAARAGLQPGDLLRSVNGAPVEGMNAFVQATQRGQLPAGAVIVRRGDQRLAFEMTANAANNGVQMAAPVAQMQPQGFAPGMQAMMQPGF
ncbi:MAG: PDZ domain-containing protein [Myxococcales bacterium]|nr:PDZ domain-containing protein [Myxococcales bacterium]